jgi:hypothetical protein
MIIRQLLITLLLCVAFVYTQEHRLVAIMHTSENFMTVLKGIQDELMDDFAIDIIDVDEHKTQAQAWQQVQKLAPDGLILMDAQAISFAEYFQSQDPDYKQKPKFVLMTLQVEKATENLQNVIGIRFEVPGYTTFTNFRIISEKDFNKVGVFYRKSFEHDITESKRLLANEQIELVAFCMDCDTPDKELSERDALRQLNNGWRELRREKVEVLWMLADNAILNGTTLRDFWVKTIARQRVPLVVPLERFAEPAVNLGVFVTQPDYFQLGAQLAGQVLQVFEEEEELDNIGFEPLISIRSIVNARKARTIRWGLNAERMGRVDKVLE